MVPRTSIPEWFDHITKGEYMTFWVRKKFPAIILCFALAIESEMKKSFNCEIRFYINSDEVYELEIPRCFSEMVTDHVWLYDLRTHPSIRLNDLESYLVDDWNQIEISCDKIIGPSNVTISWCGVHICREEANMEDILFKDPDLDLDSSRETEKIDSDLDKNYDERIKSIGDFKNSKKDNDFYCFKNLEDYNNAASHTEMDHNQDKLLLHPKTFDSVTNDSMPLVCFGGKNVVEGTHQFYMHMHYCLSYFYVFDICVHFYFSLWIELIYTVSVMIFLSINRNRLTIHVYF